MVVVFLRVCVSCRFDLFSKNVMSPKIEKKNYRLVKTTEMGSLLLMRNYMHYLNFDLFRNSSYSLVHWVIISLFTCYVLILLFKLFVHLSYYCRWINELYSSLFYSYTFVLFLIKTKLTLLMGIKWWSGRTSSPMMIWEVRYFLVMQAYLVQSN